MVGGDARRYMARDVQAPCLLFRRPPFATPRLLAECLPAAFLCATGGADTRPVEEDWRSARILSSFCWASSSDLTF